MPKKADTETLGPPLTLRYRPLASGDADIDALAFAEYIAASVRALRGTAEMLSGRAVRLHYNVSDLRKNSPALVELTPRISINDAPVVVRAQAEHVRTIASINRGVIPANLDFGALLAYKKLGEISKKYAFETDVQLNGAHAVTTGQIKDRLDLEMARDQWSHGSARGYIRSYHAVEARRLVRLYPRTGQPMVCKFRQADQAKVRGLIDTYVTVEGRMRYRPNAYQPYYMEIENIDGINVDAAPTFAQMEGFAPSLAGRAPAEDRVRERRDEW